MAKFPNVAPDRRFRVVLLSACRSRWTRFGLTFSLTGSRRLSRCRRDFRSSPSPERAHARGAESPDRGYYFDFSNSRNSRGSMTPTTPSVGHLYALRRSSTIFLPKASRSVTSDTRRTTHWCRLGARRGFRFFRARWTPLRLAHLRRKHARGRCGRDGDRLAGEAPICDRRRLRPAQGPTFRLSNMGDETVETVSHLLHCLDDCLG